MRSTCSVYCADIEMALNAMVQAGQSRRSILQAAVVLNTAFACSRQHHFAPANLVLGCHLPDGTALTGTRRR
jgi:hypothetical protein